MPIEDTKILVYRKADFEHATKAAERARDLYRVFYASVSDPSILGPREQLLRDEEIRTYVDRFA
jgi:hypothetical protein